MTDWTETRLSKAINDKLVRREQAALSLSLDQAQTVLKSVSTSPIDFTLHDHDHSFRVAERIFDLIPVELSLGTYELSLLLLSAYMHDIGMSPARSIVRSYHEYLLTAQMGDLTSQKIREFQQWLDANYNGITAPVDPDALTPASLRTAEEIVSYYSRHKHNDWSEEWIRATLPELPSSLYANWVDDVVTLCRSHHEGLSSLRSDRFDAKLVGSPSQTVNLRYLAALLRLADILEFDPERTPSIILERRDIAPNSRIYWQRDHEIAFHLNAKSRSILLTARTPSAFVHKAVLDVALSVNHELAICAALEHGGLFKVGRIPSDDREHYHWGWPSQLATDISEKDNSFVYIEGAFRPDSKRVLDLLSGVALYGNPLVAVRELLQNAVDAVKEQIAYERLTDDEPGAFDFSPKWSQVHRIRLSLEEDTDGIWLRCDDDGVGMTKDIIENHLLVSGSAARVSTRTLERETAERGFTIGRTGQFGVGTLSYFMIADRLELTTRYNTLAGDNDHTAWRFTTEGLGSFGELTPASRSASGTEVRLRLRLEAFDSKESIFSQIAAYISDVVSFLPCRLDFRDNIGSERALELSAGWSVEADRLAHNCLPFDQNNELNLGLRAAQADANEDARDRLRWLGPEELIFEPLAARIRVWLPYFALSGGNSSAYMHVGGETVTRATRDNHLLSPRQHTRLSWRGFKATSAQPMNFRGNVLVQIDLGAGATISVDRGRLSFPTADLAEVISDAALKLRVSFEEENTKSPFKLVNLAAPGLDVGDSSGFHWLKDSGIWSPVDAPFADVFKASFDSEPIGGTTTNGGIEVQRLFDMRKDSVLLSVSQVLKGGRLVITRDNSRYSVLQAAVLWDKSPSGYGWGARSFPESLRGLLCVECERRVALNKDHAIAAAVAKCGFVNPTKVEADCSDDELASALYSVVRRSANEWSNFVSKVGMKERIIELVECLPEKRIDAWISMATDQYIKTIDVKGCHFRIQEFRFTRFETYDGRHYELPSEETDWLRIEGATFEKEPEEPKTITIAF